MRKLRFINIIISIIVFPLGSYLIYSFGNWQLLLGIFLLMWGNNIAQDKT